MQIYDCTREGAAPLTPTLFKGQAVLVELDDMRLQINQNNAEMETKGQSPRRPPVAKGGAHHHWSGPHSSRRHPRGLGCPSGRVQQDLGKTAAGLHTLGRAPRPAEPILASQEQPGECPPAHTLPGDKFPAVSPDRMSGLLNPHGCDRRAWVAVTLHPACFPKKSCTQH